MKMILKFFTLKIILVVFCLFAVIPNYAQEYNIECEKLYEQFLANRRSQEVEKLEKAIAGGKEYLKKCSSLKEQEEVRDYVTKQIPKIEKRIQDTRESGPDIDPFSGDVLSKNWDEVFASGKKLIKNDSEESLDVSLVLASIGFDRATENPPIDKFNDEAITYAKVSLQLLNENKPSGTGSYGAFAYIYKTKECSDGRINATGWMNYTIGYILFARQKQTKEALPYLYQATQIGCETKNIAEIYRLIGNYYVEELKKMNNARSGNLSLQRGYANRALDAYTRAHQINSKNPNQFVRNRFLGEIKMLYPIVYNSDLKGLDLYLESIFGTPFIDPATPVSPLPKNEQ